MKLLTRFTSSGLHGPQYDKEVSHSEQTEIPRQRAGKDQNFQACVGDSSSGGQRHSDPPAEEQAAVTRPQLQFAN